MSDLVGFLGIQYRTGIERVVFREDDLAGRDEAAREAGVLGLKILFRG